jgi:predicted HTH transcriptional regulator
MIELKDEELLLQLKNFEDNFVERKTSGDSKDWLKTVVAFANTTPVGYPAVLYIGVKNDGTPEDKIVDLDSLQKTLGQKLSAAYPPVYHVAKILNVGGKQVLAVIVPGSADRPHFAGQAYVREGSKSVVASKSQFEELIASRNSKVHEILRWKDKQITVVFIGKPSIAQAVAHRNMEGKLVACTQFYVTVEINQALRSYPLGMVDISFSDSDKRLELVVHAP